MKIFRGLILCLLYLNSYSQELTFIVHDAMTNEALGNVTVRSKPTNIIGITKKDGTYTILKQQSGIVEFAFSSVGYRDTSITITFPYNDPDSLVVSMQRVTKALEEVFVSSTRTNSRIADLPIKVEVIGQEDLQEEIGIKPGNMSSLLSDLSVIHVQNTSLVTGNTILRLQGLDGRYTQLLRDGLPVYEGLNSSFGILSIPPLDLKQIEVIKGSVSTLYGGGAIAGLINFISKTPKKEPELTFLLNRSTQKENNADLFYSKRWNKIGFTLFTGTTIQKASDVNKDGFSDIPDIKQFNLHPRLFIYPNNRKTFTLGYSGTIEDRKGGDMIVLQSGKNGIHQFIETNKSDRHSIDAHYQEKLKKGGNFVIKTVLSDFNLKNIEPGFSLKGRQINTYSEASYNEKISRNDLVVGLNYLTENFTKNKTDTSQFTSYRNNTVGVFVQDGIHISEKFIAEAGLRADRQNQFGWFALPRIAIVYKPIIVLSLRLSTGAGYKIPNVFTQQSEQVSLKEMNPGISGLKAEKSTGVNFDANYHKKLSKWEATINQAFYFTNINNPLLPLIQLNGRYSLTNLVFKTRTIGTDTYIRFVLDEWELYAGYNHTIAKYSNNIHNYVLFAPQDKFSSIIAYEIESKWRMGVDVSWVGNQYISVNKKAPNYWFCASMIQRNFDTHLIIVLNAENLFDRRQGKKEALYYGSITNPVFYPVWGPIEGRVFNLSVKWMK